MVIVYGNMFFISNRFSPYCTDQRIANHGWRSRVKYMGESRGLHSPMAHFIHCHDRYDLITIDRIIDLLLETEFHTGYIITFRNEIMNGNCFIIINIQIGHTDDRSFFIPYRHKEIVAGDMDHIQKNNRDRNQNDHDNGKHVWPGHSASSGPSFPAFPCRTSA